MIPECILIKSCHWFRVSLWSCLSCILFGFWPW